MLTSLCLRDPKMDEDHPTPRGLIASRPNMDAALEQPSLIERGTQLMNHIICLLQRTVQHKRRLDLALPHCLASSLLAAAVMHDQQSRMALSAYQGQQSAASQNE